MKKSSNSAHNQGRPCDHRGYRGTPPLPVGISLSDLADDAFLTTLDAAAFLRVSTASLEKWRGQVDHPLKWERLPGRLVRYRADAIRNFVALGQRRRKLSAVGAPAAPKPEAAAQQPSPRGERSAALKRAIELFGSQQRLAQAAGVSKNAIFDALHGYRSVSHTLALKIEQATGGKVRAEELLLEGLPPKPSPPPSTPSSERSERSPAATKTIPDAPKPAPKPKRRAGERAEFGAAE